MRVCALVNAHERRSVTRTAVALEAPHGLASGSGGSGGAVCLSRWHAMELLEVQGQPAIVALAGDVAVAFSDVLVLSVAL